MRANFYIYKRKPRSAQGKVVFYVQFRSEDGGLSSALSTGQHTKASAQTWVHNFLKKGGSVPSHGRLTFGDFAKGWWVPETCPYVRAKRARGFHISDAYIRFRRDNLRLHVLPGFGDRKLTEISPKMIEEWVLG
ncbi:MAG: hypothetical protein AB1798_09970 [Spirochaetota bacterium]